MSVKILMKKVQLKMSLVEIMAQCDIVYIEALLLVSVCMYAIMYVNISVINQGFPVNN